MTVTIEQLAEYLGCPASTLLSAPPFRNWRVERSLESDLDEPLFDYVFLEAGLDFVGDKEDRVATIFVHFDDDRYFEEGLLGFSRSSTRQEMLARFGTPSKSGSGVSDSILGDFGAWDRFAMRGYSVHTQYQLDDERLKQVTLMRADVVP